MIAKENRKTDVILVLRPKDGQGKSSAGLLDPDLFVGKNTLHAKMDTQTCLWSLNYDKGILPQALKQRFTSFDLLMQHVTRYMAGRNVEIVEVID